MTRGWLVGRLTGWELVFRYTQSEAAGAIQAVHSGHSVCTVERLARGASSGHRAIYLEQPVGSGTNIFDQISE